MNKKELSEWIVNFVRHKDIIKKSILDIKAGENRVDVKFKDKEQVFLIMPELDSLESFEQITKELENKDRYVAVVCINSDKNINFLVQNWKEAAKHPQLSFYFVNPSSSTEQKWIIFPHVHNRIADMSSLKMGLAAMAECVEKA